MRTAHACQCSETAVVTLLETAKAIVKICEIVRSMVMLKSRMCRKVQRSDILVRKVILVRVSIQFRHSNFYFSSFSVLKKLIILVQVQCKVLNFSSSLEVQQIVSV